MEDWKCVLGGSLLGVGSKVTFMPERRRPTLVSTAVMGFRPANVFSGVFFAL